MENSEIVTAGLLDVIPKPKGTTTFKSYVNPNKKAKETQGDSQFREAARLPTEKEIRKMRTCRK